MTETPNGATRVALVFGGESTEHAISCLTAASIMAAMDQSKYHVIGIGITRDGRWVRMPAEQITGLQQHDGPDGPTLPEVPEDLPEVIMQRGPEATTVSTLHEGRPTDTTVIDVAFSLLHGPFGEDGTIQGLLEMQGVRYVGSGVAASANGMDKHLMKICLADAGLPIGPYVVVAPGEWAHDPAAVRQRVDRLTYPVFVKPARGGSSVGISRVRDRAELDEAMELALANDPKVIVEGGFVDAREIEVAVLGSSDGAPRTSTVSEIVMHTNDGFYDFESKYQAADGVMDLVIPADLPPDVAAQVQQLGARTFQALGAEGLARVDCFWTADGALVVNEINTMPGMTEHSGYPKMWQASGLSYPDLVDALLQLALARPLGLR